MPRCPYLHLNSPLITASAPTESDLQGYRIEGVQGDALGATARSREQRQRRGRQMAGSRGSWGTTGPGMKGWTQSGHVLEARPRQKDPKVEGMTDLSLHSSIGEIASHAGILAVGTVLGCDVLGGALPEGGFLARAPDFTQVDRTHA